MSVFRPLAAESLRDALRRRVVAAIVLLSLLSLVAVDSCTSCAGGQILVNGRVERLDQIAGFLGLAIVSTLGLWVMALAGVLGADHLQQTLEDGSAALCLARPVGRATFVLARLAGVLALAGATGGVLFAGAGLLLAQRSGLAPGPVVMAAAACAGGVVVVGAFSMAASLRFPRIATLFLVFAGLGLIATANVLGASTGLPRGVLQGIDRVGPPLVSSVGLALRPWLGTVQLQGSGLDVGFRLVLWGVLGLAVLLASFRRVEIPG
jgi:ABC-type transport system involved in multi-copper enzyme maturation permease subunit